MMMMLASLAALGGVALALPARTQIQAVDMLGAMTRDDLVNADGDCPASIYIFARGSTESGNLGSLGPQTSDVLESALDSIWIQGVGGAYDAALEDNLLPDGTSPEAIEEMKGLLQLADSTCPDAKIISGGYSQGAALAAAAIRDIDASIRDKIVGTVLFGYTKNQQNDGQIPNYPADRLKVFCNEGDLVCEGSLIVAAPHLAYGPDASGPAPEFLIGKVNGM